MSLHLKQREPKSDAVEKTNIFLDNDQSKNSNRLQTKYYTQEQFKIIMKTQNKLSKSIN